MSNAPSNDRGYPWQAIYDCYGKGRDGMVKVEKGDHGEVKGYHGNNVHVNFPRREIDSLWVPRAAIEIGTIRRCGDLVYATDPPDTIDPGYEGKITWTKTDSEELKVTNYVRPPTTCLPHLYQGKLSSKLIFNVDSASGSTFRIKIPATGYGPPVHSKVQICFEIMHGGRPHAIPWARLPKVCRFPDVDLANPLGFKINWVDPDTGEFVSRYVQSHHVVVSRDSDIPGSLTNYGSAMGMIRYLQRVKLHDGMFQSFDSDLGLARVKEVKYDHLKQLVEIKELDFAATGGATPVVTKPNMLSLHEVGDILHEIGADNIGGLWQGFSAGHGNGPGRKMMCDSCYALTVSTLKRFELSGHNY